MILMMHSNSSNSPNSSKVLRNQKSLTLKDLRTEQSNIHASDKYILSVILVHSSIRFIRVNGFGAVLNTLNKP